MVKTVAQCITRFIWKHSNVFVSVCSFFVYEKINDNDLMMEKSQKQTKQLRVDSKKKKKKKEVKFEGGETSDVE